LLSFIFLCCLGATISDWRDGFLRQEVYKITTYEKVFKYKDSSYVFDWADSNFRTFNKDNTLISNNHTSFMMYGDNGLLTEEKYCVRNCENPSRDKFYYNKHGQLMQLLSFKGNDTIPYMIANYKYKKDLLIVREHFLTWNLDDFNKPTLELYTYYADNNLKSITKREFSTNVREWRTYVDSMYYDNENKLIRKERSEVDLDLTKITYYFYNSQKQLIQTKDTAITSLEWYKYPLDRNVIHSAYYNREEFKYDSQGRIIERIIYQPDYKTPHQKIITEYVKTPIKN
jgi:hypothetical protein